MFNGTVYTILCTGCAFGQRTCCIFGLNGLYNWHRSVLTGSTYGLSIDIACVSNVPIVNNYPPRTHEENTFAAANNRPFGFSDCTINTITEIMTYLRRNIIQLTQKDVITEGDGMLVDPEPTPNQHHCIYGLRELTPLEHCLASRTTPWPKSS